MSGVLLYNAMYAEGNSCTISMRNVMDGQELVSNGFVNTVLCVIYCIIIYGQI